MIKKAAILVTAAALLGGPVALRPGGDSPASALAASYGRGELMGIGVNTSSRTLKRKVQVRAGGVEWTLHVPRSAPVRNKTATYVTTPQNWPCFRVVPLPGALYRRVLDVPSTV